MEFLKDPSILIGLVTLIILEIVLGIDNLVLVTILSDKLNYKQRDKARLIGLSIALIMRLVLLSIISWMVNMTKPIFSINNLVFSWRNLIMLFGGIFLLFKAVTELHNRLEIHQHKNNKNNKNYASFWIVVLQIVALDAIFSIDSVITAVGMVNHLLIMMSAVIIAMLIMLIASKLLSKFINHHPTVIVLCLSFLLIIGFSLVAEGFSFHIPKGYLYAAISFSILIELFNQISRNNFIKQQSNQLLSTRTVDLILKLIGKDNFLKNNKQYLEEDKYIINRMLFLISCSSHGIMTPRNKINWININLSIIEIRNQLLSSPYNLLPVCRGNLDKIIGITCVKDMLTAIEKGESIEKKSIITPATIVSEKLNSINLLKLLCNTHKNFLIVINELNLIQGLITPLDFLKVIAIDNISNKKNKICR